MLDGGGRRMDDWMKIEYEIGGLEKLYVDG